MDETRGLLRRTADHAADFLAAGAALVAVGTESFRDPAAGRRVADELASVVEDPMLERGTA